ncbi:MAG: ornithine carbamoyltransferase [Desulfobacterales bacterium CG23_combo_of_CG06-09_8_20_14_all_51_8]|nr:MAG: ornithine carbamoyltransferase [Desulfobacterales bacterium CG23_combo_of_CG06-09_8_20_14_all_51_8]
MSFVEKFEERKQKLKNHILTLSDLEPSDFTLLLDRAAELKARHKKGIMDRTLIGKSLGLIFNKPSTRTRISFEAAAIQLGATPIFISAADTQMSRNEPVADTARVLSRYLDGIAFRTFSQELIEDFAAASDIPIINALTDKFHPCQVLSDLLTVVEHKGGYEGLKIAWIGDGNNMAHSWINAAAALGFTLTLACPKGYHPDREVLAKAREKNSAISVTTDPMRAARDADVINTDVWASMGQEDEQAQRREAFQAYQVNALLMGVARKDAIVMHCLPAHRGEEITADVLEGPRSVVWDQAENKLHMHKTILDVLLKGNP